jgi:hypothetical protein
LLIVLLRAAGTRNEGKTLGMSTRGQRLVEAMKRRGIRKQFALAYDVNVNESTITRWKNDGPMSIEHAISVCDCLDISLDWFLTGKGLIDQHKLTSLPGGDADENLMTSFRRATRPLTDSSKSLLLQFFDSLTDG